MGLRQRFPAVPIAIVSAVDSGSVVDRAVAFGASGFIPKSATIETIGMMLRALLGGQIALPTSYLASSPQQKDPDRYDLISKIKTRPGSGTSLLVPQFNRLYVASQAIGDQEAAILVYEPVP
jgi:DNA-binding NarL/FixJ family response regulator